MNTQQATHVRKQYRCVKTNPNGSKTECYLSSAAGDSVLESFKNLGFKISKVKPN